MKKKLKLMKILLTLLILLKFSLRESARSKCCFDNSKFPSDRHVVSRFVRVYASSK
jgi:hypothetical protein